MSVHSMFSKLAQLLHLAKPVGATAVTPAPLSALDIISRDNNLPPGSLCVGTTCGEYGPLVTFTNPPAGFEDFSFMQVGTMAWREAQARAEAENELGRFVGLKQRLPKPSVGQLIEMSEPVENFGENSIKTRKPGPSSGLV